MPSILTRNNALLLVGSVVVGMVLPRLSPRNNANASGVLPAPGPFPERFKANEN